MQRRVWIICRKELRIYFLSPIAYQLMVMFALIAGFLFWIQVLGFMADIRETRDMPQMYPMNVNERVIRPVLDTISVIGLFFIPMITMRLFAEEKRTGTIELLATSPIRDIEVILGKWIAAVIMYAAMLATTALNFVFLFIYGKPDWKPLAIGYLGLLLLAGGLLAIGTFLSSLTKNQISAAAATFDVCLLLWFFQAIGGFETAWWARAMSYMSVITHFSQFSLGIIDLRDVVYYVTVIFLGLFLTSRSLESLRWRS
jgi:ABC-2 type transport system permease protein